MNYQDLIQKCESDIRLGRAGLVAKSLRHLNAARVPRLWRLPLANICRRVGHYSLGMHLLKFVPAARFPRMPQPTSAEMAEYAVLLLRSGAIHEAMSWLCRVDTAAVSEGLLYHSFAHFYQWDFESAIPLLQNYIRADLTPYARLVGKTNLGFAYAYADAKHHGAALEILTQNIEETHTNGLHQLESTCRALAAQVHVQRGDLKQAKTEIEAAQKINLELLNNDHFLVRKWSLIVEGISSRSPKPLEELRLQAVQQRDWEVLREVELYHLKIDFDMARFLHLYFGSMHAGFRQRIETYLQRTTDRKVFVLGEKKAPRFDLQTGETNGAELLNPGKQFHRMMDVLLRDFYLRQRVPGLFSLLFPGEYFNISSSPDRVHQIIRRTRGWLSEENVPCEIEEVDGFYSLTITGNFSFLVPIERGQISTADADLHKLKQIFGSHRSFTTAEAKTKLSMSTASVYRLIEKGRDTGVLIQVGSKGRSAAFKFSENKAA
jgi:tetratricopeptide (TPR) repeat protein